MNSSENYKKRVKNITNKYWSYFNKDQLDESLKYYITHNQPKLEEKSLLEVELDFIKERSDSYRECNVLVLMVGYSIEPLLQSIAFYQPNKIILLLNEDGYGAEAWHIFSTHIIEAIQHLKDKNIIKQQPEIPCDPSTDKQGHPIKSDPALIFQKLVELLLDEHGVVIDVTGGKKSMVTGAFMYGVYAGVRISYVDFLKYDTKSRRPYGYTCQIGELANPPQDLSLWEWDRVRYFYTTYSFSEAKKLLQDSISKNMGEYLPSSISSVETLCKVLDYYEKWDHGDFKSAYDMVPLLKEEIGEFTQPSAVEYLGKRWSLISGHKKKKGSSQLYKDKEMLKIYAYNELKSIERLIKYNQDYRSAFLRSGGVNETIMLGRIVEMVDNLDNLELLLTYCEEKTPAASTVFKALTKSAKEEIKVKGDLFNRTNEKSPDFTIPKPFTMNAWWKKTTYFNSERGWGTFLDKRNELAHKYFSVTQDLAKDALKFVQFNLEDFLGESIDDLPLHAEALSWSEICHKCKVHQYLPPRLR